MSKNHLILAISAVFAFSLGAREIQSLDFGWTYKSIDGKTVSVDLPHDFQISQPWVIPDESERPDNTDGAANVKSRLSSRGFKEMGQGVYQRQLFVPDSLRGKRLLLDFGGIMLVGDVYLNGEHVGGTDYGYLGFEIDITDRVRYDDHNEIMVIADTGEPQNSRWYTGGGLFRGVNLVITSPDLYFNRHDLQILTSDISPENATIAVIADINAAKGRNFVAKTRIIGPDGQCAAQLTSTVEINRRWRNREYTLDTISIANPALWDCDNPDLYTAYVTLYREDGSVADSLSEAFGIRAVEFSPDFGMKLNGKKVYLKGIANHHSLGALGAAAYPRAIEKRIKLLKDFGFNHIRTSHNPYSKEFLDLCDRYGMLVVDELYDKWLTQYAGGRKLWTELWQTDIPEWVRRDRNHPSVVIWSLGNELQGYNNLPYNDWGVTAYRLQKTLLDRYDTSRPVTVAMHPRYRSLETDSLPAPLVHETDIAAYNYRYMYFPGDAARFPGMIFYQSEANLSNMGPNYFIPQQDDVIGLAYWGMIDYLGESLGWPAKGWTDGVFDISLEPKPNAWLLKSMFVEEPVVKIGVVSPGGKLTDWNGISIGGEIVTDSWTFTDCDTLKLYTYTNADEVSLMLNGKEIGRKANNIGDPMTRNRISWHDISYQPGTLVAVAYKDGAVVASDTLVTSGKADRLIVEIDNPDWHADGYDLQHIRVTAVDSQGNRSEVADDMLTFDVMGEASLVAACSGDMTSDESFTDKTRSLYRGRALAILRATQTPGDVTLSVSAPDLEPITLKMTTK